MHLELADGCVLVAHELAVAHRMAVRPRLDRFRVAQAGFNWDVDDGLHVLIGCPARLRSGKPGIPRLLRGLLVA